MNVRSLSDAAVHIGNISSFHIWLERSGLATEHRVLHIHAWTGWRQPRRGLGNPAWARPGRDGRGWRLNA